MSATDLYETTGPEIAHRTFEGQASDETYDIDAIVNIINKPRRATGDNRLDYSGRLHGHQLIGFGEEKERCGEPFHLYCECCGGVTASGDCCRQPGCPRCASEWCRLRATENAARLWGLLRYQNAIHGQQYRLHHVVVSPADYMAGDTDDPEKDWCLDSDQPLEKTKEVVKELLRDEMNAQGLIAYHEYRAREKDDPYDVQDSRGIWKKLVFSDRDWDDVKPQLVREPHFHCIVVAPEIPGGELTETVYDETHWVIHRIHDARGRSIDGQEELAAILAYCLSHTTILPGDNRDEVATWWFGRDLGGENQIVAYDEDKKRFDFIVRAVAPRVLDLDYNQLICPIDRPIKLIQKDPYDHVDVDKIIGSLESRGAGYYTWSDDADPDSWDTPSSSLSTPEGDLPDQTASPDMDVPQTLTSTQQRLERARDLDLDDAREMNETERVTRCSGRLFSIAKSPRHLNDPDWCERAEYADSCRETYEGYAFDDDHWIDPDRGGYDPP